MKSVTQNDLQEIKELIKNLAGETTEIKTKLTDLEKGQLKETTEIKAKLTDLEKGQLKETTEIKAKLTDLEKGQIEIKATLQAWKPSIDKIPDLAEKVGGIEKLATIYRYFNNFHCFGCGRLVTQKR